MLVISKSTILRTHLWKLVEPIAVYAPEPLRIHPTVTERISNAHRSIIDQAVSIIDRSLSIIDRYPSIIRRSSTIIDRSVSIIDPVVSIIDRTAKESEANHA